MVAPHAGAWIEIGIGGLGRRRFRSLPMRERGLKFGCAKLRVAGQAVAPHAGAWIEIGRGSRRHPCGESLPMRERGLKLMKRHLIKDCDACRSPCGSVD